MSIPEPVGYVLDDEHYCPDCLTDEDVKVATPIFASEEVDAPCHCNECKELLPLTLTSHGAGFVFAHIVSSVIAASAGKTDGNPEVLLAWYREYWDVVSDYVEETLATQAKAWNSTPLHVIKPAE